MMPDDNNAPGLSIATALFFIWSVLTFAVRAWVKLRRSENWGLDDSTITLALFVALCHVVAVFSAIHAGYGSAFADVLAPARDQINKAFYASHCLYVASIGLSKISTAFFISHLTRYGPQVTKAYVLAVVCGLWTIASILVVGIRGNISQPWSTIDGSQSLFRRWLGVESSGAAVELALWILSVNIIWSLSMPLSKRLLVLSIFGCRLLLIPLIVLRLYYLSPGQNSDPVLPNMTSNILTEAVLNFAFISASVTCLKPFLRPFHSSYVVSTVETGSSAWRSANSRDPYYMLSAVREGKDGVVTTTHDMSSASDENVPRGRNKDKRISYAQTTSDSRTRSRKRTQKDGIKRLSAGRESFRPDKVASLSTVEAIDHRRRHDKDSLTGVDSMNKSLRSDAMVIHKTETWSVRIETEEEAGRSPIQRPSPNLRASDIGVALSTHVE